MGSVGEAVAAIRAGRPVVLPADTVYGLVVTAHSEQAVAELYRLKGRPEKMPTALLCYDLDALLECVPELRGGSEAYARALLPGPYTLILPNPARRFPWLNGRRPEAIGVRVPALEGDPHEVLEQVTAVAATSANLHGGPDPRRLDDVPTEIRRGAAAEIDGGELPGTPSTVLDLTGADPRVVREGAMSAADAFERLRRDRP